MPLILNFKFLVFIFIVLVTPISIAENLVKMMELAMENDAPIKAARERQFATMEELPIARASLLPVLAGSASNDYSNSTNSLLLRYNTHSYGVTLTQPVLNLTSLASYRIANERVKSAAYTYASEEQNLIIRVTTQYFRVLQSLDAAEFAKAERKAFSRHLEETQQRFEVGIIAITDVHEAQARHDSAYAQEIAADNDVRDQKEIMEEITGKPVNTVAPLKANLKFLPPQPNNIDEWVTSALEHNLIYKARQEDLKASKLTIERSKAGHYPTISLNGNLTHDKSTPPGQTKSTIREIGLSLSLPIFSGGATSASIRQAVHTYNVAEQELVELTRQIRSRTKQAFRGIITKVNQIQALEQAVRSTNSALEATQAAFEVGTRTIVDVLNAQSDVINARRNYSQARYDYILESFRLKREAGVLSNQDIYIINEWLQHEK